MDTKTRAILERPFEATLLKQRQGPGGQVFTYVEVQFYIDRLNAAFLGDWSLENVRREILEDQIVVEVKLTAAGIVKTGVGGGLVTRRRDNGRMVNLADDVKKAESDAIKRACRLLGIGGSLYGSDAPEVEDAVEFAERPAPPRLEARTPPARDPHPHVPPPAPALPAPPARSRLSSKQLAMIWGLAQNRNIDRGALRARVRARYGVQPEFLSKGQASEIIDMLSAGSNGSAAGHDLREAREGA